MVAAKIAVDTDDSAADVARAINAAEQRIRDAVPAAGLVYLEPDLLRAGAAPADPTAPDAPAGGPTG